MTSATQIRPIGYPDGEPRSPKCAVDGPVTEAVVSRLNRCADSKASCR